MSSASINDQVRRTVLHHCFQGVRSGTPEQLALWDSVLDHFNIQAPKKEDMLPPSQQQQQQQQGDGAVVPSSTAPTATTPSRDQMQRLGRKLSQLASKMYGLSVDALNNHEMFFVCVILDLKEFVAPTPAVPVVAVAAAQQPPASAVSPSPSSLYMDDDIASTPPPPPHAAAASEVIELVETPPPSAAPAVVAVPTAAAVVMKTPSKRAMQVILENFHYSKNPLPQRVRRAPEVLVYDPPLKAVGKKAVSKKSAAAAATAAVPLPAAVAPVLGTKRDRPVVEKKKQSKLPTTTNKELTSVVAPGASSRTNKTGGSNPTTTPATPATSTTAMPVHTNSAALMMSNLMDSSSSYCSTSDDDAESEGVTENEVTSGGLTVNRQDVFDFKQKKGISALAEDVDYGDDDLDDDEDTPEGRRRRKQLKLVEVLRLEGMLTVEIALKVLNSGAGKGGGKKAAAAAGGDPPATAADVALHFDDIIRRGFAVKDFDDTIFLCS